MKSIVILFSVMLMSKAVVQSECGQVGETTLASTHASSAADGSGTEVFVSIVKSFDSLTYNSSTDDSNSTMNVDDLNAPTTPDYSSAQTVGELEKREAYTTDTLGSMEPSTIEAETGNMPSTESLPWIREKRNDESGNSAVEEGSTESSNESVESRSADEEEEDGEGDEEEEDGGSESEESADEDSASPSSEE